MENKKLFSVGFLMSILVLSMLSIRNLDQIVLESEDTVSPKTAANRSPIYINGNSSFTIENGVSAGDGTFGNQYIIENWTINASSSHGIRIWNTNAYVIIRNCTVTDGHSSYYGIYFQNVQNVIIENNTISNNKYGIYLGNSGNNTITHNNASNNRDYGIYLGNSINNTITNNTAFNNSRGINLWNSSNSNTITNNIASNNGYGIQLYHSSYNTITNNTASNNIVDGFFLSNSSNSIITNNNASNNSFFGISLYSSNFTSIKNNLFDNNERGCIYEIGCTGNIFNDNICNDPDSTDDFKFSILGFPILPLLLSVTFAALILIKKQRTH